MDQRNAWLLQLIEVWFLLTVCNLLYSSLDSLVKNLSDSDLKYLSVEFSDEFLRLVKQKKVYPYEYMDSFKKFSENKLADRCRFFSSLKDVCISEKDYLKAINI